MHFVVAGNRNLRTSMVYFSSSPRFVDHRTGPQHPERPDRIRAVAAAVRAAGLVDSPNPFPEFSLDFGSFPPAPGKVLELPEPQLADEKWIELIHPRAHIERVRHVCEIGGGVLDQGDTPVSEQSFDVAKLAVGAVLQCCDAVMAGTAARAFAAVRPPGHHAEPDRAMGFCLFANVAIAVRYLQARHSVGKVAVVDFDVHHGNGTQAAFETDPTVLFISLHQDPRTCYPGSGYAWETGEGAGTGTIINIPMNPGSGDAEYLNAFHTRVLPALDAYKPEMLLISAGFDAHRDDPLAQIDLSEDAYEQMTRLLVQAADAHTKGRIVSALEGGYNLRALGRSVVRHLVGMM
ncbi:MAG: putative Deacetylase, histone deacetylase family [Phycisphaerales bacterium]|nr:putative Deacetylase, histone deacetylase family [Phycisphaerales bacterium]